MTEAEVRELLAFAACYDRTLDVERALPTWVDGLDCAWVPNLGLDEARAAILEHYERSPVRVYPADILQRVRDDRLAAVRPAGLPRYGVPPNEAYREARAELEAKIAAARKAGTSW